MLPSQVNATYFLRINDIESSRALPNVDVPLTAFSHSTEPVERRATVETIDEEADDAPVAFDYFPATARVDNTKSQEEEEKANEEETEEDREQTAPIDISTTNAKSEEADEGLSPPESAEPPSLIVNGEHTEGEQYKKKHHKKKKHKKH